MSKHWYDKYSGKDKTSHHSFWSDEFDQDWSSDTYKSVLSETQIDSLQKYKLSAARKAISNFVTIATGQSVPVKFSTGNESYTDGKEVTLSGDIDDSEKFDIGVGLSLHEASHILLSDFTFLRELRGLIPADLIKAGTERGDGDPFGTIKNILNVVEDRRIDAYIYSNAPGYREYYLRLYNHYFGDKLITEALEGDEWKTETIENYMNRLINLMNPATSLTALKGMKRIWNAIDLKRIDRLKTTADAFDVALEIYRIILASVATPIGKKGKKSDKGETGDEGSESREGQSPTSGDDGEDRGGSPSSADGDGEESEDGASDNESDNNKTGKSMSDAKRKRLEKTIEKQRDFLNGQTKKKKVSKKMAEEIEAVEQSGAELVHAGEGLSDGRGRVTKGVDVVVYKKTTRKMLEDGTIKMAYATTEKSGQKSLARVMSESDWSEAVSLGVRIGKKLQVRNESRNTVFTHQRNGKIDKRLIHSLGFDAETVFNQTNVDRYKAAHIHLSIDASASMNGSKWRKTMVNTVALCKAVSMIPNLSMQVSFRYSDGQLPIVAIAWDSRKEAFKKVETVFPYLGPYGTTPEGLCFEAISKLMTPSNSELDSYFINISDGEPAFCTHSMEYIGRMASAHTRREVDRIRKSGIGVLSYFVSDDSFLPDRLRANFTEMYGRSAAFVSLTNVGDVVKTMNQMLLSK